MSGTSSSSSFRAKEEALQKVFHLARTAFGVPRRKKNQPRADEAKREEDGENARRPSRVGHQTDGEANSLGWEESVQSASPLPLPSTAWFVSLHQHKEEEAGRRKAKARRRQRHLEETRSLSKAVTPTAGRSRGEGKDLRDHQSRPRQEGPPHPLPPPDEGRASVRETVGGSRKEPANATSMWARRSHENLLPTSGKAVQREGEGTSKRLALHLQRLRSIPHREEEAEANIRQTTSRPPGSPTPEHHRMAHVTEEAVKKVQDAATPCGSPRDAPTPKRSTYARGPDGRWWTLAMYRRYELLINRPCGRRWTTRKLATLTKGVTKASALLRFYRDRSQKVPLQPQAPCVSPRCRDRASSSSWCVRHGDTVNTTRPPRGSCWLLLPAAAQREAFFRRLHRRLARQWSDEPKAGTTRGPPSPADDSAGSDRREARADVGRVVRQRKRVRKRTASETRCPPLLPQWEAAGVELLWKVLWHVLAVRHRIVHEGLSSFSPSTSPLSPSPAAVPGSLLEARSFPLYGLVVDVCEGVRFHLSSRSSKRSRRPRGIHSTARTSSPSSLGASRNAFPSMPRGAARGSATSKREVDHWCRPFTVSRGVVVQETAGYVSVALFPEGWSCLSPPSTGAVPASTTTATSSAQADALHDPLLPCVSSPSMPLPPPLRVVHIQKVFPSGGPGTLQDVCQTLASSWSGGRTRSAAPRKAGRKKNARPKRRIDHHHHSIHPPKRYGPSTAVVSRSLVVVVGEYWEIENAYCRCAASFPSPSRLLYDRCL